MTYIKDNLTLKTLITRSQNEMKAHKYSATTGPYMNIFFEHWEVLDADDKKTVCQMCLDMTMNLKGADSKTRELDSVRKLTSMQEYSHVKEHLMTHIDALPVKNGNQVLQRYVQALVWGVELDHYHMDKVNDKTSFTLRGWLLRDVFNNQKNNDNIVQWLSKRLLVTAKKNTVEENVMALTNVKLEALNAVELARYWSAVETVYHTHANELSVNDVVAINTTVGRYLDTCNDLEAVYCYKGIPDVFLSVVPVDDPYMQKYATNRFFNDDHNMYYFGHTDAFAIPMEILENNRLYQERTAEKVMLWNKSILRSVTNRKPSVVDSFYFEKGTMGFKVLLTLVKLLTVIDDRLHSYNSQILPQLYTVGAYLGIDVEPLVQSLVTQDSQPRVLESVNATFGSFMKNFVDKIHAYNSILYDEDIQLAYRNLELDYQTGTFVTTEKKMNYIPTDRLLSVYESVLKDMGADLGYTKEEIELLF